MVAVLRDKVPLPLLAVLDRISGEVAIVRLPLFQVIGLSCVMVMLADPELIVPLPELTVMDLPIVQAVVVLGRREPPLKVKKSATSVPDPNRLGAAKLAVPALRIYLVTLPPELLNSAEPVPTLVMVPAYGQLIVPLTLSVEPAAKVKVEDPMSDQFGQVPGVVSI